MATADVEVRRMEAAALYSAMETALAVYSPHGPVPCRAIYSGLSVYAALRVEHPSWTREEALEAAAFQIADHVGLTGGPRCSH